MKGCIDLNNKASRILIALTLIFALCALAGTIIMFKASLNDEKQGNEAETDTAVETDVTETEINNIADNTEPPETEIVYENIPVVIPEIDTQDFSYTIEAEDGAFYGALHTENSRSGYSGRGYVTGYKGGAGDRILFYVYIPSVQHYDITVKYAADTKTVNYITIDGEKVGTFETDGSDKGFKSYTLEGMFLSEGYKEIEIIQDEAGIDIDCIEFANNTYVYENENEVMKKLSNENASEKAKEVMSYLVDMYGKGLITGQYASSPENIELETIKEITGRYPVIRFGTLTDSHVANQAEINACKDWTLENGGISGLMWYWGCPMGNKSIYAEETDFDLSKAVTSADVALKDIDELEEMCANGKISEECLEIIRDIDEISAQLKLLKKSDVPLLWRPLHEAGGGWYWWGSAGNEAYNWLWELLYKRQTVYHGLDNLIWVWNGQSKNYVVDEALYDIASVDVYEGSEMDYGSHFRQYKWLYMLTESRKLVALSECGTIPDIDEMFRDNAMFSFFGLWFGEYILDEKGNYSEKYTSKEAMKKMYNSDGAITLDEYINGEMPSEEIIIETQTASAEIDEDENSDDE